MTPIVRYRHLVLATVATLLVLVTASDRGFDLELLLYGARDLAGQHTTFFGPLVGPATGLHLYAAIPGVQVGPLALLFVLGTGAAWGDPGHIACLLATVLGLVAIVCIERAALPLGRPVSSRTAWLTVAGGSALCLCWADTVQRWGHVDDALVALAAAAAVLALSRGRLLLAGLLIGLAIGAKPTALPLVALLVTGPGQQLWPPTRARITAMAVAGATACAVYLPFVLADSRTLHAVSPQLPIQPASVLSLFGMVSGSVSPPAIRILQLALALGLGLWATRRHGAMAGLLAVSAGRLLLDPGDYSYYALPLVLAAVGLAIQRGHRPALAWCATAALVLVPWLDPTRNRAEGLLTLVVCVAAVATATRTAPLGRLLPAGFHPFGLRLAAKS